MASLVERWLEEISVGHILDEFCCFGNLVKSKACFIATPSVGLLTTPTEVLCLLRGGNF